MLLKVQLVKTILLLWHFNWDTIHCDYHNRRHFQHSLITVQPANHMCRTWTHMSCNNAPHNPPFHFAFCLFLLAGSLFPRDPRLFYFPWTLIKSASGTTSNTVVYSCPFQAPVSMAWQCRVHLQCCVNTSSGGPRTISKWSIWESETQRWCQWCVSCLVCLSAL